MGKYLLEKRIIQLSYIYCCLPVVIFLIGWVKFCYSIPCVFIVIMSMLLTFKSTNDNQNRIYIEYNKLFIILIIILTWVVLSGIGKMVYQNEDHFWRNATYEMLVNSSWPVKKEILIDGKLTEVGLVYYIGFWLPAAIIGKCWGITVGYLFQILWAVLGIGLFYLLVSCFWKQVKVWPLILFIFFSGLDIVGYYVLKHVDNSYYIGTHLEWWAGRFQYSSFTTQLFWAFNQSIPAWLLYIVMMRQKNCRNLIFLMALNLISCPLPCIGMVPFLVYKVFFENINLYLQDNKSKLLRLKELFSFQNIAGGGIISFLSYLYLRENSLGSPTMTTTSVPVHHKLIIILLNLVIFLLLEVVPFFAIMFYDEKKNPLFWITIVVLLLCPVIRIGKSGDFCMRASIPALVSLYILLVNTIKKHNAGKRIYRVILVLIICLGGITPLHEIARTVINTFAVTNDQNPSKISLSDQEILGGSFEITKLKDSFFFTFIAKQ